MMKKYLKIAFLFFTFSLSLVSCREEEKSEMEQMMEEEDAEIKVKEDKIKVKTDEGKAKIKTDDDGGVKKKVKIENDDN